MGTDHTINVCPVNGIYTKTVVALSHQVLMMRFMDRRWISDRIDEIGSSQRAVAKALKLPQPRISEIIAGKREIKLSEVAPLAQALGLSVGAVMSNLGIDGMPSREARVPLVGSVSAGGGVQKLEAIVDYVDAPPGAQGPLEALRVDGASMFPELQPGDLVFFSPEDRQNPIDLVNRLVVLETVAGDLRVKYLRRGSAPGLFDLFSHAEPVSADVPVARAARVLMVDHRGRA